MPIIDKRKISSLEHGIFSTYHYIKVVDIAYMAKIREWSDEEVERLRNLYTSNKTFDEIAEKFPLRTGNAIRLKASRLGIRRPIIDNIVYVESLDKLDFIDKFSNYLTKCTGCGSWIQINENLQRKTNTLTCEKCGEFYHT